MSESDPKSAADALLERALESRGLADPRPGCRALLRQLRATDPDGYGEQIRFYEEELLPGIVGDGGGNEPVAAWTAYSLRLAAAFGPGRTVAVDGTGRASSHQPPGADGDTILYIPDEVRTPITVARAPSSPSSAQVATVGVLTQGWRSLPSD